MLKCFALAGALFAFLGVALPAPPVSSAAHSLSATVAADALPPLFDSESSAQRYCHKARVKATNATPAVAQSLL